MRFCYSEVAPIQLAERNMGNPKTNLVEEHAAHEAGNEKVELAERLNWETPRMEDVSEQVMAQPYIRFT